MPWTDFQQRCNCCTVRDKSLLAGEAPTMAATAAMVLVVGRYRHEARGRRYGRSGQQERR